MADTTELWEMLREADQAGDTAAAARITEMIDEAEGGAPAAAADPQTDQPGWDWLRNNYPDLFTGSREFVSGVAEGVGNLPNAIPNVFNRANEIIHLHTDEPGAEPPEPVMDQWMTGTGFNDKSLAEMNPPTPGWEGTREYGQLTGGALPAGPAGAVAIPALSKLGSGVGSIADYFTGDPAMREQPIQDYLMGDAPQGKWAQTGEFAAPMVAPWVVQGGRAVAPAVSRAAGAVAPAVGPLAALATLLKTGSLPDAYVAGKAVPATLRSLGKTAAKTAPVVGPLLDAIGGSGLGRTLGRAAVAGDERRR